MLCSLSVKARKGQGPPGVLGSSQVSLGVHINDLQQYKETLEQHYPPPAACVSQGSLRHSSHWSGDGFAVTTASRRPRGVSCLPFDTLSQHHPERSTSVLRNECSRGPVFPWKWGPYHSTLMSLTKTELESRAKGVGPRDGPMMDSLRSYRSWLAFHFLMCRINTELNQKKKKVKKFHKHPSQLKWKWGEKKTQTLWDYFHYFKVHILFLLSVSLTY